MEMNRSRLEALAIHITDGEHGSVIDDKMGRYYLLSNKNIMNGNIVITSEDRRISRESFEKIRKRTELAKGDLIISTVGSIGKLALIRDEEINYEFQRSCGIIKCNREIILPEYCYYYLNLPYVQKRLVDLSKGAVQKCLFISDLQDLLIDYPRNLTIQEKIVSVLSSLDKKIEVNSRINSELGEMAKTLYDYWFVQFDFPDENGKPYKSSGGEMVWNDELKREVPRGWGVRKLGNILHTSLGGTPSTRNRAFWDHGEINWLNSGEVANFPVVHSELKITREAIAKSATELLPKGTTLLSITRHLRPTILAIDACANQSVVGIKERGDIKCYYIYQYLINEIPRFQVLRTGAQQPHINKDQVDESRIIIPDVEVLRGYNLQVEPYYRNIIANAFQNQRLRELRDWLLPMLMNGQVTVN